MNKNNELISIIVPCYNVEKVVERCFNSLIIQKYSNIEILFIDDGSKDNTKEVLKSLLKKDNRCYYYYKNNGGLSSARNYGLKKIKGKYVCFIDSDDYVDESYILDLYTSLKENKTNISICDIERVYKTHKCINRMDRSTIEMCRYPAAWNKMYLSSLFKDVEFPEEKWYEDLGTTPKLTMVENYSIVNKPLYKYVQNDSSITHTYDDRIYQIYSVIENLEKYAEDKKIKNEKYQNLEFINVYHILVGTIFRSSFTKEFKVDSIKNIHRYVEEKYPMWHKNKYIKNLGMIYKIYLFCLKNKFYHLIYIIILMIGKKMSL